MQILDQLNNQISVQKKQYLDVYNQYKSKKNLLTKLQDDCANRSQEEFFQFQYDDIHQHHFKPDEEQLLHEQKKLVSTSKKLNVDIEDINIYET